MINIKKTLSTVLTVIFISHFVSAMPSESIPLPTVPDSLKQPVSRADYIIEHFWDEALPTLSKYSSRQVEQSFSNFISVFPHASQQAQTIAFDNLIAKANVSENELQRIYEIADKYLYSPDSPIESEDYYILFLNSLLKSPVLSESSRIRPSSQLSDAMRNRPGSMATDFTFELRTPSDAEKTTLSKIINNLAAQSRLMLVFYDPECGDCHKLMKYLSKQNLSDITVVAVYSGDDRDNWLRDASSLPDSWIVGYDDGTLQEENLYVLRYFPTIYMIDGNGTVVQKEADIADIKL